MFIQLHVVTPLSLKKGAKVWLLKTSKNNPKNISNPHMPFFILKLRKKSGKYLTPLQPLFFTGPVCRSEDNTGVSQVPELFTLPLPGHSIIKATGVSAQECQSLLQVGFGRKFSLFYPTSTVFMCYFHGPVFCYLEQVLFYCNSTICLMVLLSFSSCKNWTVHQG